MNNNFYAINKISNKQKKWIKKPSPNVVILEGNNIWCLVFYFILNIIWYLYCIHFIKNKKSENLDQMKNNLL